MKSARRSVRAAFTASSIAALLALAIPGSASAQGRGLSLHLDLAGGVPTAGYLAPLGTRDYTAHVGIAGWMSLDYVVAGPFALELIGGGGRMFELYENNPFQPNGKNPSGFNWGMVGFGGRLRFLDTRDRDPAEANGRHGGNLWLSAHLGYYRYSRNQFGMDAAAGYEWSLSRAFALGVFTRGFIGFHGEGRAWIPGENNTNAALFLGLSGSFQLTGRGGDDEEEETPPADTDGDGVLDEADRCPTDAEDVDDFEDADGCPDPDNDADGVADGDDACPLLAGLPDNHGCPSTDRDGDGVPDHVDNCPDEAGSPENHGCVAAQVVQLEGDRIDLLERVMFRTNSASLDPQAYQILEGVARVLNAHPEISRLAVEGHTDETGPEQYNRGLSERRARAVVDYLVHIGHVDRRRLAPEGFSSSRPRVPNADSPEEHEPNRRVEFRIVAID